MKDIELYNDSFQNYKVYGLPKAQLIIADVPYCYDTETECFTRNGWKKYTDILPEEEVLSLNHQTQRMEYSGIANIIVRDNDEDMIQFKNQNIDLFVSANHRCYTVEKFTPNLKFGERIRNRKRINTENIRLAKNITAASSVPRSGYIWTDFTDCDIVVIPGVEIKHNGKTLNSHTTEDVVINTIDWLRFFGLYLADGSYSRCSGSGYTVSIKQHNRDRDKVRKILSNLPFKFSESQNKGRDSANYNIYSKQLYCYLEQFGRSADKFIPRWILDLPTDKLKIFLESYTFGDSSQNGPGIRISSISKKLILGLQEVALKLGTLCQIYTKRINSGDLYQFQYNPLSRNIKYGNKKVVADYTGKVWCLTLKKNSVFLVRRNGSICFSGNCLGDNAYASNPAWYIDGDNKNGESALAGKQFFSSDSEFRPAEFMHFCSKMLVKEPKEAGKSPCMILFCEYEQQFKFIELGRKYGLMHYIPLVFRKDFSAQVLKANMKVVGNCEYGLILYRDKLPKFNNNGRMIFNCFDWVRDNTTPKCHPCQKPVPLLKRLIEIFTDKGDVVIDPCAGSGTTLYAAASLGRKAYGFEVNKQFYNDANEKVLKRIQVSLFQ